MNVESGTLTLSGGGTSTGGTFDISRSQTLAVNGSHTLNNTEIKGSGNLSVSGGTFTLSQGTTIANTLGLSLNSGTLQADNDLTLPATSAWNGGTLSVTGVITNSGTLTIGNSDLKYVNAQLNNTGSIIENHSSNRHLYLRDRAILNNSGNYELQQGSILNVTSGIGTFNNSGTFNKTTADTAVIGVTFNNTGTVNVESGTLNFSNNYTHNNAHLILKGGTVNFNNPLLINGGSIEGNGRIDVTVTNAGLLNPRHASNSEFGRLTINSNYTETDTAGIKIELGGNTPGINFDQVHINGTATFEGTLNISLLDGFTPSIGSTFDILTFNSLGAGSELDFTGLQINSSLAFLPELYSDKLTLKVVPQSTPTTLSISPTNATQSEGNEGTTPFTFTVTRTGDTTGTSSANWAVTGTGENPANAADFGGNLPTGTVTFAAGETSQVITVNVQGDTVVEPDETFTVTLFNPSNATLSTATATGTILNDDASLAIAPLNAIRLEGNSGTTPFTFTVTRTGDTTGTSTANWAVTGTGTNPANAADFGGAFPSGTVTFTAGEISQIITVNVSGDTVVEPEETFTVSLSNPSNATITTATATGTIVNDDLLANPGQLAIAPQTSKVTPAGGEITLKYRVNNFNDTQISSVGLSIYFDSSELNINTTDINLSSSVGTIVGDKIIIDDTENGDNDPNTDKELTFIISPLQSTDSDNVFVNIPFTTTAGFDGESTVNFAGSSSNPNIDVLGVPSVTVSGLAADIDGNGRVTGADLLFIDQYLLLRNNPNVNAILQSSFNLFSTETVGATNTTGAALRSAIANGVNRLAFDVDGNEQVTGGDIFLIRQGLLLKNNPNVNAILQTTFNLFTSELTGQRNTGAEINAFISELLG
ncbi:hypothetical protein NWP21_16195 [Anabaenopsis sp. FSS-46]|uniref:beta strand repeat-containing protein n=1 Tax=Anabaenopsis sp. FSS-46 TaxID=2971766 RepID=UPI0024745CFB|nr:Calx-beta domain-containing protein [Anabaenopsis sp. FSS-46]MDH6100351.1 hypothetical protein [Anabaenopsis sp. FSS-46]